MKQLFALDFLSQTESLQLTMTGNFTYQYISDKLAQLKKSQNVSRNRKISKIPVVVLFVNRFPKKFNTINSPTVRGLATKCSVGTEPKLGRTCAV